MPGSAAPDHVARCFSEFDGTLVAVKGDRVEVLVDVGSGVQRFDVVASRAGRRVEVSNVRGTVEVTEVTRSGTPVRTARFMAAKVVAVVEHPAVDRDAERAGAGGRGRARAQIPGGDVGGARPPE